MTINLSNTYLGFTESMKPMTKAKTEKMLNTLIRSNGMVLTEKEWVYTKLQNGSTPNKKENYSYYSSRTSAMTKPKTLYTIEWNEINHNGNIDTIFNEINKTLYDFACHIINNNLLDNDVLQAFVVTEQKQANEAAQYEADQQAAEQAKIEAEKQENEQYKQWLTSQVEAYNNVEKIELYLSIFNDAYPERPASTMQARTFLVYVDNIHVPQCRQALKERLHVGNKVSKKIFCHITGVKLANTDKETMPVLDYLTGSHYYGIVPYKQKQDYAKGSTSKEMFYRYIRGIGYIEAYGDKLEYKDITSFLFSSSETGIVVIESKSGCVIARGSNKADAMDSFKKVVDDRGIDTISSLVNNLIEKNGISPLYKQQEAISV